MFKSLQNKFRSNLESKFIGSNMKIEISFLTDDLISDIKKLENVREIVNNLNRFTEDEDETLEELVDLISSYKKFFSLVNQINLLNEICEIKDTETFYKELISINKEFSGSDNLPTLEDKRPRLQNLYKRLNTLTQTYINYFIYKKLDVISNKIDLDDELFKPNIYEELSTINYSLDKEYKTLFKEEV